jgi:D-beta-D-heptose 7-phosphate kinase/D-beta-D-heptose 1-phosphate adenosyltransferase
LIQKVLEIRQKRGFFLAVDPKPKGCLNYAGVDLITPNRAEAFQLAGLDPHDYKTFPAEAICRSIYQKYPSRYLVITLGKDGMLLCESGEVVAIMPTYAREVFDVSGAGDTSIAALTVGLTAGFPLKSVAHFANTAAGVVVGKLGTATATPGEVLGYHE